MRGKKQAPKRKIAADSKYNRVDIQKFINYIMRRGKKTVAERIVYGALDEIQAKTKQDPLQVYDAAIKKIYPQMEVRSRRVGGAHYQIPFPVRGDRQQALAFRWLIKATKDKKGKSMKAKLADELLLAAKGEGAAIKKKEDVHRMAESNRAFAHFARYG
jgi:small subunit ribosomal protein S7